MKQPKRQTSKTKPEECKHVRNNELYIAPFGRVCLFLHYIFIYTSLYIYTDIYIYIPIDFLLLHCSKDLELSSLLQIHSSNAEALPVAAAQAIIGTVVAVLGLLLGLAS